MDDNPNPNPRPQWHSLSVEDAEKLLCTTEEGLSDAEAQAPWCSHS